MKINLLAKLALIKGLGCLLVSANVAAWSVSENVVEIPTETLSLKNVEADGLKDTFAELLSAKERIREETLKLQMATVEKAKEKTTDAGHEPILEKPVVHRTLGLFEKKQSVLSLEEEAILDYHQARDYLTQGEDLQAEKVLLGVLSKMPTHQPSRIELVNQYIKTNRDDDAEILLNQGLKQKHNNPDYLRLLSLIHDKRGDSDKALSLLLKVPENHRQNKEYVAFLGHLYQQLGQFSLARQQYFRLLSQEPQNSLWILGAAIALESEGKKKAALEGYTRLRERGGLEASLLRYVQERITHLKG